MRVLLTTSLFVLSLMLWGQKTPKKVDGGYKIEITTSAICGMCKDAIESDLIFEKGVKSVVLDVDSKIATFVYNPKKTNPQSLRTRITKIGYNADSLKRDQKAYDKLPECCKDGAHKDGNHTDH